MSDANAKKDVTATEPEAAEQVEQAAKAGEFDALKTNILSPDHWIRLFFMVLFGFVLQVASLVVGVVVVLQFLFALLTGSSNENLRGFGASLTAYIADTLKFLTYNSEDKPFPFADWPDVDDREA
ncbi:DUF4389 domain-containing protein [Simiduia sp. 21SJ11W-1]|uniref:DUF4389 domain-containing protein n=1 Tax=Simiduia sp. 21SJ11W-1 TaxID=2909669 RepID=UPI00209D2FF9|nr:DUF4389 domain-containing protein [Simiduia sp. 21SJ11W-1]UTA46458.1 DUF4389 domain-containing protein [Simiduia sp. 21SJ11W-1]